MLDGHAKQRSQYQHDISTFLHKCTKNDQKVTKGSNAMSAQSFRSYCRFGLVGGKTTSLYMFGSPRSLWLRWCSKLAPGLGHLQRELGFDQKMWRKVTMSAHGGWKTVSGTAPAPKHRVTVILGQTWPKKSLVKNWSFWVTFSLMKKTCQIFDPKIDHFETGSKFGEIWIWIENEI